MTNIPTYLTPPKDRGDVAANIAHFLLANGLSIFATWSGKLKAADQRLLFGFFLGKGTIVVNGLDETVENRYKACYGETTEVSVWLDCKSGHIGRNFWSVGKNISSREREIETAKEWF